MRKSNIIILALVIALMAMGAGYAYWTDSLTIDNTVSTGELKVEFVKAYIYPYIISWDDAGCNYVDADIQHGAKTTTVTMGDLYPGTTVLYEALIENLGSIPAVIDDVKVEFSNDSSDLIKENLIVYGMVTQYRPNSNGMFGSIENFAPIGGFFEPLKLKDLGPELNKKLQNWRLEPGDFITFDITDDEYKKKLADTIEGYESNSENCLIFHLSDAVGDELEEEFAQFDITFNFKQHNQ